jgi:hypothetical protein
MSIYDLPKKLRIEGRKYKIRSDFRACLDIFAAFDDEELTEPEKAVVAYEILYAKKPPEEHFEEAVNQAYWFLNGGDLIHGDDKKQRLFSWEQDSTFIFSGIDKSLGYSSRSSKYLHWWEFLAAFMDISDGMFSNILRLRQAKSKGKLTKEEREYYTENKALLELTTKAEREEIEKVEKYFEQFD